MTEKATVQSRSTQDQADKGSEIEPKLMLEMFSFHVKVGVKFILSLYYCNYISFSSELIIILKVLSFSIFTRLKY